MCGPVVSSSIQLYRKQQNVGLIITWYPSCKDRKFPVHTSPWKSLARRKTRVPMPNAWFRSCSIPDGPSSTRNSILTSSPRTDFWRRQPLCSTTYIRQYRRPWRKMFISAATRLITESSWRRNWTMGKEANYMLNQWDGIEAIPTGGDYSWDNNLIERVNRYISLSRKNSLFFGSHAGAERGCIFYSLACSCRLHGINFFEYLSDILNRADVLQRTASTQAYRDILPDRWKKE